MDDDGLVSTPSGLNLTNDIGSIQIDSLYCDLYLLLLLLLLLMVGVERTGE